MCKEKRFKEKQLIYAIRDTETGALVSDTNIARRLYYKHFANAENSILAYKKRTSKPKHGELEIVAFELEEVATYRV